MTRKQLILRMLEKLPEDVAYDRVAYHLGVMKAVEEGEEDLRLGRTIPHDQVFDELLKENEPDADRLDSPRRTASARGDAAAASSP